MSASKTHPGVMVGVDGSPASNAAVNWAARDAARRNVPLTLVHVIGAAIPMGPETPMAIGYGQWQEEKGREVIADAVKIATESSSGRLETQINTEMLFSSVVPTLVDLSKDAQMIVVGSRGRGALARTFLGSVSSGLVHHAHCPVGVIHDADPLMKYPGEAPVLLGIDGSPASELATAIAFEEASMRGVDLVALHSWADFSWPAYERPTAWFDLRAEAEETLAERLAGWKERYPGVNAHRVVMPDRPAQQLIERSDWSQLTVVGSHGRGGFAGMLVGSVGMAVVNAARMPVIVARQS